MQLLGQLGPLAALVVASLLGASFGFALAYQLKLQRLAQTQPLVKESRLVQRLTFAGLSMSILLLTIIAGKHVSAVSYEVFVSVAAAAAIAVLVLRQVRSRVRR